MILANTSLEHFVEPIGIGIVNKVILTICILTITTRQWSIRILGCLTEILTILISIHYIVRIRWNNISTKIALVINLQWLILQTVLCSDDYHTIRSTRSIDCTCSGIFQYLNSGNIVWREITDSCTHRHTIYYIKRGSTSERSNTTDSYRRIGTWLTIRSDLHTSHLTLKHGRDVRIRNSLHFLCVYNSNRTGQIGTLLSTVTYNNNLFDVMVISRELNLIQVGTSLYCYLTILITYIAN